jgi:hypothetical protein
MGEKDDSEGTDQEYLQIDILKAAMIALVIFDHAFSAGIKAGLGIQLWERLSVPTFLVITGFNYGRSFHRRGIIHLLDAFKGSYLSEKLKRYLMPFALLMIPMSILSILLAFFDVNLLSGLGPLPFWGPGIWYIPVILWGVLILPPLYISFQRRPKLTLVLCFVNDFAMHWLLYWLLQITEGSLTLQEAMLFFFQTNVLYYLSAVALGMWFSGGHGLEEERNRFIWFLLPLSLGYLLYYEIMDSQIFFLSSDYNLFGFPYAAFIFLVGMAVLPRESDSIWGRISARLGKGTYHILLTQAFCFSILYRLFPGFREGALVATSYVFWYLVVIVLSFTFGSLWRRVERGILEKDATRDHTSKDG